MGPHGSPLASYALDDPALSVDTAEKVGRSVRTGPLAATALATIALGPVGLIGLVASTQRRAEQAAVLAVVDGDDYGMFSITKPQLGHRLMAAQAKRLGSPGVSPPPESSTAMPDTELLTRLADLHAAGVLTDAEFAAKKKEILDQLHATYSAEQASAPPPSRDETRICPYCAEPINNAAVKCRWCQSDLPDLPDRAEVGAASPTVAGAPAGLPSTSLTTQANILMSRGDLDVALTLYEEQEQVSRELGYLVGLQRSLGGQANIHYLRGDLDGAMTLHHEEERICRELGDMEGLANCLGGQANILSDRGDRGGATALAEEAYQVASQHGLTVLAQGIQSYLDELRHGG